MSCQCAREFFLNPAEEPARETNNLLALTATLLLTKKMKAGAASSSTLPLANDFASPQFMPGSHRTIELPLADEPDKSVESADEPTPSASCCGWELTRRRRRILAVLCSLCVLWWIAVGIFAAVTVTTLTNDLRFVICEISACVPKEPALSGADIASYTGAAKVAATEEEGSCKPCLSPNDECAQKLDELTSRTLDLPLNVSFAVFNPLIFGYAVDRVVLLTSLSPLPPLSAQAALALDPLEAHDLGIAIFCDAGRSSFPPGWGDELSMRCHSKQDGETIHRLSHAQRGIGGERFYATVAFVYRVPVLGWTIAIAQDASHYAANFDFGGPQPLDGLEMCSGVSAVQYGAPANVLKLYDFEEYKVGVCATDLGSLVGLSTRVTSEISCMLAPALPYCGGEANDTASEARMTIPIEMYNAAGFNLTLWEDGSETLVYDAETGERIATGHLERTEVIPARSARRVNFYSDLREFLQRYSGGGLVGLAFEAIQKTLASPVRLDINVAATLLGTKAEMHFEVGHTSLIGLAQLVGCRCEVGPGPECRSDTSVFVHRQAESFGRR